MGLLVGDALGVPYEFHAASAIPEPIEYMPPLGFRRAHAGVPPATYSDDGAQALALLDSLLTRGRLDVDDLAARIVAWYARGDYAVDGRVFDVGTQTSEAIRALRAGVPALEAGPRDERKNGNGALMRVLPLALVHSGPDAALVADAEAQSQITHGHAQSRTASALYCLWARRLLEGEADAWGAAVEALRSIAPLGDERRVVLDALLAPEPRIPGRGSGWVVDTVRSARDVLEAHTDYADVVRAAIRLGDDTDSTAAVAGGLAGVRAGETAIPARWRDALRGRELIDPLVERLVARRASGRDARPAQRDPRG